MMTANLRATVLLSVGLLADTAVPVPPLLGLINRWVQTATNGSGSETRSIGPIAASAPTATTCF